MAGTGVHSLAPVSIMHPMLRRRHPPLPSAIRPLFWVLRSLGMILGVGALTRLPDYLLVNSAPGGSPSELIASHSRALELVAESGHYPLTIAAPELPQIALDSERAAIEWAATRRRPAGEIEGSGPLWSRPERHEQIDAWHGYGAPESPA